MFQADIRGCKLTGADGLQLHLHCYTGPAGLGDVLVVPGKGEHGGRYAELAGVLEPLGWRLWGLDLRGQGLSDGPRSRVARFAELVGDVHAAVQAIRPMRDRPLILLGYSMGAAVAVHYTVQYPANVQGLILVSPCFRIDHRLKGIYGLAAHLGSWLIPHRVLTTGYDPAAVTTDPLEQQRIAADPLIDGTTRPRFVIELHRAARRCVGMATEITSPVLTLISPADRIVDPLGAHDFHQNLKGDRLLVEYPGLRHDLLHERERTRVQQDITTWLTGQWGNA